MSKRLPDEEAACRRIASARREERNYARRANKTKSITIPLEMIGGLQLSTNLAVTTNLITEAVIIQSSSFVFRGNRIHPGTHGKRRCGSGKALKMLEDSRKYIRDGNKRRKLQKQNL